MQLPTADQFASILGWLFIAMAVAVVIAVVGLLLMAQRIRNIHVPDNADYFTTLRYIPVGLAILLDLLDFGLDIFAAPIAWVVLERLGLRGLRNKAAIEAFIPFTQPIPTFTLSWFVARTFDLGEVPWRQIDPGLERRQIDG